MIDYSHPIRFAGRVGETPILRALTRLTNGELATPTNVANVGIKVQAQGGTVTYEDATVAANTCLLETPELGDETYNDDHNDDRAERGYNLKWVAPATAFPASGWYTVRFLFTGSDASVTLKVFEGVVRGTI